MPIYEYRCNSCEHEFDIIQQFSDKPLKKCPECGGKLVKLMSNSSFHLKGTGWYKTDYADKKGKKETEKPVSADKEKKEADGGSKDSKKPKESKVAVAEKG